MIKWLQVCFVITMLVACGGKGNGGTGDGGTTGDDGGSAVVDAPPFSGMCDPDGPQCSNCIDDDKDGQTDGFDIACTGPLDNDEATFATGIPGDNKDPTNQDCFFDGDSGEGNDGCNIHICCLLGIANSADCPFKGAPYDPATCTNLAPKCQTECGAATPPGCDCFGCCTVCDPNGTSCVDVNINPAVSPGCTPDQIDDPNVCKTCTKNTACNGGGCNDDPSDCILCPGQDPSSLPPGCGGMTTCPDGEQPCGTDGSCPMDTFCSSGCCVGVIL